MKKIMLSLLGAATLAISTNAMALIEGRPFMAAIDLGVLTPIPVGTLTFIFTVDEGLALGCGYVAEWDSNAFLPFSGQCSVVEAKTLGFFSCGSNASMQIPTFVTIDKGPFAIPTIVDGVASFCTGFDQFQQFREVGMLMLAELPVGGPISFEGIVIYDGVLIPYGIQLI
jgi:hypothetical protein